MAQILTPSLIDRLQAWLLNGPERAISVVAEKRQNGETGFYVQVGSHAGVVDYDGDDNGVICDGSSTSLAEAITEALDGAEEYGAA